MNIFKRLYYKKVFKDINNVNDLILKAERWEDIRYSYEARPPFTWTKDIDKLNLLCEYFDCVNKSYKAEQKVAELCSKLREEYEKENNIM